MELPWCHKKSNKYVDLKFWVCSRVYKMSHIPKYHDQEKEMLLPVDLIGYQALGESGSTIQTPLSSRGMYVW